MSLHLQKFIDRVQGTEARGLKDFTMSMTDAKSMHADLTRLLLELQALREKLTAQQTQEEVVTIEVGGGSF